MSNFRFNPNDKQNGKVVYNAGILNGIVALAVEEVEGTVLISGKRRGISLFIEKDGIYADVSVIVKYGYNVPELAYRIQQSVKQCGEHDEILGCQSGCAYSGCRVFRCARSRGRARRGRTGNL